MREYRSAVANEPTSADVLNDFGYFLFTQGDLVAAEANLRSALAVDQEHERAWTNLGIVLAHLARDAEAFEAFARVVGPAAAHSNLGAIMAKQGRKPQAMQAFSQALEINPGLKQPQAFLTYYAHRSPHSMVAPASFLETAQRHAP